MKKIISIFSLVFFGLYFSAMAEVVRPGETNIMCTVDVLGATSASDGPVTKIKALWCPEPTTPEHATTCVLNAAVPGTCSYTTNCELGYQPTGADRVDGQNGYKSIHPENYESTALCPSCEAKQIKCSAGYYLPAGSETCATCPAGYYCPGSSNAGFTNGYTYTGAEQGKIACPAGSHSVSSSASSTNTKCELCTAGTTSNAGAGTCSITCSNNTTGAVKNWVEPKFNPTTPDWTGNSTPTVNNICTIDKCNSGYGFETNKCTACTAGNYCRGGTNPSKVCPIGSYSGAKASTCTECADYKTTDHEGATSINDCQLCSNSTGASTWADNAFDETTGTMSNVCSVTSCEATYAYGAGTGASPLPDGYTQLEYIESTGTQYIIIPHKIDSTEDVSVKYMTTGVNTAETANAAFGVVTQASATDAKNGCVRLSSGPNRIGYGNGSGTLTSISGYQSLNTWYEVKCKSNGECYINGDLVATFPVSTWTAEYDFALFGRMTAYGSGTTASVTFKAIGRLASCKIGNSVNLIPAKRNSDNVIGMYDTVSGQLFTNDGTGTFTAGPAVARNLFDKTTATLGYISDSGVITDSTTSYYSDFIPCSPSTTYTASVTNTVSGGYLRVHEYDENRTWIRMTAKSANTNAGLKTATGTTSANAKYLRISGYLTGARSADDCQLEIGSTVTPYVPYGGGATAGGTCTQCTDGYYCRGGTEPAKQCPLGSYNSTGAVKQCSFCPLGTTTTSPGATARSQCKACPNATGVSTSGWQTPTFNSDNSFVNNKCSVSSCNAGYAYISTENTAGYIEIAPSDTTTYHVELTGWKAFTLNGSETWSTQAHFTGTYDVAMSETATDSPVRIYNENYTTAATLPTTTAGKVIQDGGYIGFGTTIEYSSSDWTSYLNAHPHTVLAQLATSDASKWRAVKRVSDGAYGYYCTEGAQTGTFVGAKGMSGTETSTRHWLDSESAYQNACSVCPAGQFCSGGKTVGTQCSIGQYSQAGASTCTPCAIGSYTDATGQAKCTVCTAGETTSVAGKGNCDVKCANNNGFVNSWSSATWKVTPSTSSINTTNSVSSSCKITNCSAGAYYTSTNSGNTNTCTACPAGSYKDATAGHTDTACSLCGIGTTSSMGATALSQCTACPNSAGVLSNDAWTTRPTWNETSKSVDYKCELTGCEAGYKYNNSMLPYGYTQLEYIQSTGTQYIDTGLTLNQDAKIESKWQASSTSSNWVYGAGASNPRITVYRSGAGNLRWGNATVSVAGNITNTVEMVQDKTGVLFNGKFYPYSSSSSFTTSVSLTLFKANGSSGEFFSGKMYYVKIYDNDVLKHYFVPAKRNSDNTIGMYDTIKGKFYENKGTGTFTAPTTTVTQGASSDYQNICSVCVGGNYCPGGIGNAAKQEECTVGSWSDNGASTCETCTPGKTTRGTGTAAESACEIDCPGANDAHFTNQTSKWQPVTWNKDNTVTNLCKFANCNRGYSVEEGTYTSSFPTGSADQCNANTITLNYDVNGGNAIDSGECVYDGSINFPSAPVHPSGWEFNGWIFSSSSNP